MGIAPDKISVVFPGGSAVKNPPAMQESQERQGPSLGHKDRREEGMATLSSILSWRIPWREEPGGLQSTGLQSVGSDLAQSSIHDNLCYSSYTTVKGKLIDKCKWHSQTDKTNHIDLLQV